MEIHRKHLLDKFIKHLSSSYVDWCEQHEVPHTDDRLLTFLIDQDLIPTAQILRFTVLREMKHLLKEGDMQKTQNVCLLANRFNLSERTIWNILKQTNMTNIKLSSNTARKNLP